MTKLGPSKATAGAKFCTLAYRPIPPGGEARPPEGAVLILMLEDGKSGADLFVSPNFDVIVHDDDRNYINALLEDFKQRSKADPATLFKQLSSLGVGPLVTHATGTSISDHAGLSVLCSSFVEL